MTETGTSERSAPGGVLTGWISRLDLALELDPDVCLRIPTHPIRCSDDI